MTTPVTDENTKCLVCKRDAAWHAANVVHHAFNDGSQPSPFGKKIAGTDRRVTPDGAVTVQEAPWPFDPVLRHALIKKGVITPEDLRDAEQMIRAVTAQLQTEMKP